MLKGIRISRGQIIGAVLAWALIGSLLFLRAFSLGPERNPGEYEAGAAGSDSSQPGALMGTPTGTFQHLPLEGATLAASSQTNEESGLSTGEMAPETRITATQTKPAVTILADDGGMFYFSPAVTARAPTPTWYVRFFTPKPTSTPWPTFTPPNTPTPRATFTPRYTATLTPTPTQTHTNAFTATATPTPTPTLTHTSAFTPSPTLTVTNTPSPTLTLFPSRTATATLTVEPAPTGSFAFVTRGKDGAADTIQLLKLSSMEPQSIAELDQAKLCGWSPDGSRLLVRLQRGETLLTDLHLLNMEGVLTPLTEHLPGSSQCGAWSDDGEGLLFPYTESAGVTSLVEMNLETRGLLPVYQDGNRISQPSLSQNGNLAVFTSANEEESDIILLDLNTGLSGKLTAGAGLDSGARISPDGQTVVFHRRVKERWVLFTLSLVTREETMLTLTSGNETQPDWSVDGSRLLFISDESEFCHIYIYEYGGTVANCLMPDTADRQDSPLWRP